MKNDHIKKILVCVDDSGQSATAIKLSCTHASKVDAIVEMIGTANFSDAQKFPYIGNALKKEMEEKAQGVMEKSITITKQWPEVKIICKVLQGTMAEAILQSISNDDKIMMVVLGIGDSESKQTLTNIFNKTEDQLTIPITLAPSNLTDQQIRELYENN
ncbi:hypothetical protein CAXC1_260059 [Candidatus Xenohaliotis californiensis]|uniref:UspA domain-containing protein n=1 Tax=Candidatus Xenohaliotis californiensis TaxID=84677 RepID=A0ABP0EV40_9RICK|nr:hypothetical protein CAXC1_260059 [Candidatus Xenohaliotis californiensis]